MILRIGLKNIEKGRSEMADENTIKITVRKYPIKAKIELESKTTIEDIVDGIEAVCLGLDAQQGVTTITTTSPKDSPPPKVLARKNWLFRDRIAVKMTDGTVQMLRTDPGERIKAGATLYFDEKCKLFTDTEMFASGGGRRPAGDALEDNMVELGGHEVEISDDGKVSELPNDADLIAIGRTATEVLLRNGFPWAFSSAFRDYRDVSHYDFTVEKRRKPARKGAGPASDPGLEGDEGTPGNTRIDPREGKQINGNYWNPSTQSWGRPPEGETGSPSDEKPRLTPQEILDAQLAKHEVNLGGVPSEADAKAAKIESDRKYYADAEAQFAADAAARKAARSDEAAVKVSSIEDLMKFGESSEKYQVDDAGKAEARAPEVDHCADCKHRERPGETMDAISPKCHHPLAELHAYSADDPDEKMMCISAHGDGPRCCILEHGVPAIYFKADDADKAEVKP